MSTNLDKTITIDKTFVDRVNEPGEYRDLKLPGFMLAVGKSGTKTYKVKGRIKGTGREGKPITVTIGRHGAQLEDSTGNNIPLTASNARGEAKVIIGHLNRGKDPRQEKKDIQARQQAERADEQKELLKAQLTFSVAFEKWSKAATDTKDSTKQLYRWVINAHLKDWLDKPLAEITPEMVRDRYAEAQKKSLSSANNAFRALRCICNWVIEDCEEKGIESAIARNPVKTLSISKTTKWQKVKPREIIIEDKDLKPWFDAVMSLEQIWTDYYVFTLLTGLRKSESAGLLWENVNFKTRQFEVKNTKNGKDHWLPMTDYIFALLKKREAKKEKSIYVFPGKSDAGHLDDTRHQQDKIKAASGVAFHTHDLRRSFSSIASVVGVSDGGRKRLLNHLRESDVTDASYTKLTADQLRGWLRQVENHILDKAGIENQVLHAEEKKAVNGNVVPIRARR